MGKLHNPRTSLYVESIYSKIKVIWENASNWIFPIGWIFWPSYNIRLCLYSDVVNHIPVHITWQYVIDNCIYAYVLFYICEGNDRVDPVDQNVLNVDVKFDISDDRKKGNKYTGKTWFLCCLCFIHSPNVCIIYIFSY